MSIKVENVYKRWKNFVAVNGVSIDIADGEFFVLLGPSGCGKTTTLRMIAGLETPSDGRISIRNRDVTYAEPRHRDIAMAFQDYGLYPNMTVYKNIEFPLKVRKVADGERKRKVQETAERLGLTALLDRKPGQISGGQRQRVSLARALVRNPHVFLMDEPLSNLDAKLRATMRTEIRELVTRLGITTVYVTHDQIEAMSMADRIGIMSKGDMVQIGRPLDVYDRPRSRFVAEFIGSPPMNLLDAKLGDAGAITCSLQHFADAIPGKERAQLGDFDARNGFLVGIRPEHLVITQVGVQGSMPAEVALVEPLGQTTNVHVRCSGIPLIVVTDRTTAKPGDTIGLVAPPEHIRAVGQEVAALH